MTVNITLSDQVGGSSYLPDMVDGGEVTPGDDTDFQDVFISHDALVNPITDCAIYIQRCVSSGYLGTDPDADITQLLGWGDASLGGVKMVMDGWTGWVVGTKNTSGTWLLFKNGYGDINNQIILSKDSIVVGPTPIDDGEIPVGGEAHVQILCSVPSSPGSSGYKGFTMVFAYSATS